MSHMNQRRQNIRFTSKSSIVDAPTPDTDLGSQTHLIYAVVVDQGQLYTDLTGIFPVRSSKGNSYVMVRLGATRSAIGVTTLGSNGMVFSVNYHL
jgi:hypothetical protein